MDQPEAELPEALLLPVLNAALDPNQMTSLDLAVLITARHRTVRQALKAASLLAERREWHHLEECADMLCRSPNPDEQLLGLHLLRRSLKPAMKPELAWLVRSLAQSTHVRVADSADAVLNETLARG